MIVAFFGQAEYSEQFNYHDRVIELLERIVGDQSCDFYLGGIDHFDHLMRRYCAEYQKTHPRTALFLIVPNCGQVYRPVSSVTELYDAILYPNIEALFPMDAISRRDRWMVDRADVIITSIGEDRVSEDKTYQYAVGKSRTIYHFQPEIVE